MFIVTLPYQQPLGEIDALMRQHVALLKRHYKSGLFIASGRQVPPWGGIIPARSGDRSALEAAIADDPFVAKDAARFEVLEFTTSMTASGAEVLKSL
jgi:uncharacterized protein YciI